MSDASRRTPLHAAHIAAKAIMCDFAGWAMPMRYGSQIEEHRAVRADAGMFDVSHMAIIDVSDAGAGGAKAFLQRLLANDVGRLAAPGQALYGLLLNERGGIIDDVIAYRLESGYRVVANASTRGCVLNWLAQHASAFGVELREREDLAMIAVQGPQALQRFAAASGRDISDLRRFHAVAATGWMIARTGYTGEDGLEAMLPAAEAPRLWQRLEAAGVRAAGLGARDTLRLEAGLNLHGQDMDESTSPLESNLAWTVAWKPPERDFIGRRALEAQRERKPLMRLRGLVHEGRGVLRRGMQVATDAGEGVVTSGSFAPALGLSIGLARLPAAAAGDAKVALRGAWRAARIVAPPFVRNGARTF